VCQSGLSWCASTDRQFVAQGDYRSAREAPSRLGVLPQAFQKLLPDLPWLEARVQAREPVTVDGEVGLAEFARAGEDLPREYVDHMRNLLWRGEDKRTAAMVDEPDRIALAVDWTRAGRIEHSGRPVGPIHRAMRPGGDGRADGVVAVFDAHLHM